MNIEIGIDIEKPLEQGYTIYSKDNCKYCTNVKHYLTNQGIPFYEVTCDAYINTDSSKQTFLETMAKWIGKPYKMFPMVFQNGSFLGGYTETKNYIERELDTNFDFSMMTC